MNYELRVTDLALKIKKFILDILFPVECLGCKEEGAWLCERCSKSIHLEVRFIEKECLDRVLVCASYDDELLKTAIHIFKYDYVSEICEPLGKILVKVLRKVSLPSEFLLVPVPLHKRRIKERGFNQAELLALEVAKGFGAPVVNALCRKRYTVPQVNLKERERQKNVQGAFGCLEHSKIKNQNVILVDDVLTTGATLVECTKILKENGAKEVWGLVLAKG